MENWNENNNIYDVTGSVVNSDSNDNAANKSTGNGKPKKAKSKGKFVRKALCATALAAIFGVSAGAGMYGAMNYNTLFHKSAIVQSVDTGKLTAKDNTDNTVKLSTSSSNSIVTTDVTSVVKACMPSIVAIDCDFTTTTMNIFGQTAEQKSSGSGSGIIVAKNDKELIIVTNNHVISNANSMKVTFADGKKATAYLKGTDSGKDIGVVAVELSDLSNDTLSSIAVANLGDSNNLTVGEPAIAIGNALGYGQSVTTGVVSATNREIETQKDEKSTFIQTDAAINPGNSGGALLNSKGEVIGVTSSKIGATTVEGMGFAIPISDVVDLINQFMNSNTKIAVDDAKKGALGVSVMSPTGIEGAYVAAVTKDSAADKAGIKKGDLITGIDKNAVDSASTLTGLMKYYAKGDEVTITLLRKVDGKYQTMDVKVTLDSAKDLSKSQENSDNSADDGIDGNRQRGGNGNQMPGDSEGEGGENGDSFFGEFPFGF